MILRRAHLDALSEPHLREFEEFMVEHLNKWFPEQCDALGDLGTRRQIRTGISRAEEYDIVGRRDVCKYIDLMFALGPRFDEDAAFPWAQRVLSDERLGPSEKVNRLVAAALEHRRLAAGTDAE